jgi:hypothetical protein
MNPLFLKKLRVKKKRPRDPNAPPPPTLLGQVKELKTTRELMDQQATEIQVLKQRLEYLESKNRRLENYIETIKDWVMRNRK